MVRSIPDREQLAVDVADLIHAVSRQVGRSVRAELGPHGVTWGQVRALRVVDSHDGPVRMGVIAEHLGVVPRSATSVVDDLVEQGLAERATDPTDRRAVAVTATEAGRALLAALAERRRSAAGEVLGDLSPAELDTMKSLLSRTRARPAPPPGPAGTDR